MCRSRLSDVIGGRGAGVFPNRSIGSRIYSSKINVRVNCTNYHAQCTKYEHCYNTSRHPLYAIDVMSFVTWFLCTEPETVQRCSRHPAAGANHSVICSKRRSSTPKSTVLMLVIFFLCSCCSCAFTAVNHSN